MSNNISNPAKKWSDELNMISVFGKVHGASQLHKLQGSTKAPSYHAEDLIERCKEVVDRCWNEAKSIDRGSLCAIRTRMREFQRFQKAQIDKSWSMSYARWAGEHYILGTTFSVASFGLMGIFWLYGYCGWSPAKKLMSAEGQVVREMDNLSDRFTRQLDEWFIKHHSATESAEDLRDLYKEIYNERFQTLSRARQDINTYVRTMRDSWAVELRQSHLSQRRFEQIKAEDKLHSQYLTLNHINLKPLGQIQDLIHKPVEDRHLASFLRNAEEVISNCGAPQSGAVQRLKRRATELIEAYVKRQIQTIAGATNDSEANDYACRFMRTLNFKEPLHRSTSTAKGLLYLLQNMQRFPLDTRLTILDRLTAYMAAGGTHATLDLNKPCVDATLVAELSRFTSTIRAHLITEREPKIEDIKIATHRLICDSTIANRLVPIQMKLLADPHSSLVDFMTTLTESETIATPLADRSKISAWLYAEKEDAYRKELIHQLRRFPCMSSEEQLALWQHTTKLERLKSDPIRGQALLAQIACISKLDTETRQDFFSQVWEFCDAVNATSAIWQKDENKALLAELRKELRKQRKALIENLKSYDQLPDSEQAALRLELTRPYANHAEIRAFRLRMQLEILGISQGDWQNLLLDQREKLKRELLLIALPEQKASFENLNLGDERDRKDVFFKLRRDTRMGRDGIRWGLILPTDGQVNQVRFDHRHYEIPVKLAEIPDPDVNPTIAIPRLKDYMQSIVNELPDFINDEGSLKAKNAFIQDFNNGIETIAENNTAGYSKARRVLGHLVQVLDQKQTAIDNEDDAVAKAQLQNDFKDLLKTLLVEDIGLAFYHCADRRNGSWDNIYYQHISGGLSAKQNAQEKLLFWLHKKRRILFDQVTTEAIAIARNDHGVDDYHIDVSSMLATYRYQMRHFFGLGEVSHQSYTFEMDGLEDSITQAFTAAYQPQAIIYELYDLLKDLSCGHCTSIAQLVENHRNDPLVFTQKVQQYFETEKDEVADSPGPLLQKIATLVEQFNPEVENAYSAFYASVSHLLEELHSHQLPSYDQLKTEWLEQYYPALSMAEKTAMTDWDDDGFRCWWSKNSITLMLQDFGAFQPYI